MVLRHVNFERGTEMTENLETFLSEAIGLKYGVSANKFRRQRTASVGDEDEHTLIDPSRTFFCSELVAKAFKCLGVIENDKKSCS